MRIAVVLAALFIALPAAAQFSGMPGCNQQTNGLCENGDNLTGTDYENVRAYLSSLSTLGAHTDGADCPAGEFARGVTAGHVAQGCTAVATQSFGTGNPPGTCTQGTWYGQTATTIRNCVCVATNAWQCSTAAAYP